MSQHHNWDTSSSFEPDSTEPANKAQILSSACLLPPSIIRLAPHLQPSELPTRRARRHTLLPWTSGKLQTDKHFLSSLPVLEPDPEPSGPQKFVTITVGNDATGRVTTPVHKTLICKYSAFFQAAFDGEWVEGQTQAMDTLDEVEPGLFSVVINWLYLQVIKHRKYPFDLDVETQLIDVQRMVIESPSSSTVSCGTSLVTFRYRNFKTLPSPVLSTV